MTNHTSQEYMEQFLDPTDKGEIEATILAYVPGWESSHYIAAHLAQAHMAHTLLHARGLEETAIHTLTCLRIAGLEKAMSRYRLAIWN